MTDTKKQEEQIELSLRKAITDALENKRRLGQYAVVAEDGKPKRIDLTKASDAEPAEQP